MNISYHAWNDYGECPRKYFLRYRKRQPPTVPQNDYFAIYGKLTEKFFQNFSNIWCHTMPYMPADEIRLKLSRLYDSILATSTVNWSAPFVSASKEDIFEQSFKDVFAIMESHNQNYFLNSKSEVSIDVSTKDGAQITGRLDFIHKDALSSGISIFDGKGSTAIGKNVSDDQVLYYALLYFFHFKILADQLGFFYYRFNTFVPVPFSISILNEFRAKVSLRVKAIMGDSEFKPTPSGKACRYCDYRNTCAAYLEGKASRSKPSKLDLPDQEGVVDLGF